MTEIEHTPQQQLAVMMIKEKYHLIKNAGGKPAHVFICRRLLRQIREACRDSVNTRESLIRNGDQLLGCTVHEVGMDGYIRFCSATDYNLVTYRSNVEIYSNAK